MTGSHCLLGNLTTCTVYPWPALPAAEVGTDWLFIYYLQCQRLPLACSVKMGLWHLPTSPHQLARWMCSLSGRGHWREAEGKLRPPSWVLQGRHQQAHTVGLVGTAFLAGCHFLAGWVHAADPQASWPPLPSDGAHLPTLAIHWLFWLVSLVHGIICLFVFSWLIEKPSNDSLFQSLPIDWKV